MNNLGVVKLYNKKIFKMSRKRIKYILSLVCILTLMQYFGFHLHLFEKDFDTTFDYPLAQDILPYIEQLRNNEVPKVLPINTYNYSFHYTCPQKCKDESIHVRLVLIVKSALDHFDRRIAIRNTWGFENRFSDVEIRTIFLLGVPSDPGGTLNYEILRESAKYRDIAQCDFHDTYFNNTIKTMMGFKWAMTFCPRAKFFMFSDDDMYISMKNVLRFIRNPSNYPEYVEESLISLRKLTRNKRELASPNVLPSGIQPSHENTTEIKHIPNIQNISLTRHKRQIHTNYELPDDVVLYTGFMFNSSPHRHRSSKWYISLNEYPWHMWPPYVSAGAYIISRDALTTMYYASYYTKHFRFDDIYLGLLAKKSDIEPFHSKEFYFYKKDYSIHNYRYVIASHGFDDPNELMSVWNEQRAAGNA